MLREQRLWTTDKPCTVVLLSLLLLLLNHLLGSQAAFGLS